MHRPHGYPWNPDPRQRPLPSFPRTDRQSDSHRAHANSRSRRLRTLLLVRRSTPRYLIVLPDGTSLSERALQKVRAQDVGHCYVERRLHALGAPPLRAGMNPAAWVWDALDDVHAVRLRHGGNLRYAMLTSHAARRHVRLRLPDHHRGRAVPTAGTIRELAGRGITGLPYPKVADAGR